MSDSLQIFEGAPGRYEQQVAAGEWSGPAARDWLSCRYPCGRHTCQMCNPNRSGYGYRGLPPWSQVIASWGPGFRPRRP